MTSTVLGNLWQTLLTGATDPVLVQQAFMSGLGEYLTTSVTANVIFSGSLIAFPNSPIIVPDVVKISGASTSTMVTTFPQPNIGSDGSVEWLSWMNQVYAGISLSTFIGPLSLPIVPSIPVFTMITPSFTRDILKDAHLGNFDDPQGFVLDALAIGIMTDMQVNFTRTFPATYLGMYTGICTVNSIITP